VKGFERTEQIEHKFQIDAVTGVIVPARKVIMKSVIDIHRLRFAGGPICGHQKSHTSDMTWVACQKQALNAGS
jgi:hypothetical protein